MGWKHLCEILLNRHHEGPPVHGRQPFLDIVGMLSRRSRGRPVNAPAAFIHPCQPTAAKQPPTGPVWAHELKHDGYRLQIHVRNGRVRILWHPRGT